MVKKANEIGGKKTSAQRKMGEGRPYFTETVRRRQNSPGFGGQKQESHRCLIRAGDLIINKAVQMKQLENQVVQWERKSKEFQMIGPISGIMKSDRYIR